MSTIITLENEALCVQIAALGAEIQSIVSKETGRENLWNGDTRVWRNRAPWLFPIIGQLRGGTFSGYFERYISTISSATCL